MDAGPWRVTRAAVLASMVGIAGWFLTVSGPHVVSVAALVHRSSMRPVAVASGVAQLCSPRVSLFATLW